MRPMATEGMMVEVRWLGFRIVVATTASANQRPCCLYMITVAMGFGELLVCLGYTARRYECCSRLEAMRSVMEG